jgi:rhodanese-related sulfurtransferase
MQTLQSLVEQCLPHIGRLMPWDLAGRMESGERPLIVDVREPEEFAALHIPGSINVPRGILEAACEYGYTETVPELAATRDRPIVLVCRSGNRSALAAHTLSLLAFKSPASLMTGLRGWNDYDQPLVDAQGMRIDADKAEQLLNPALRPEQLDSRRR